jgi:hypothetical protein
LLQTVVTTRRKLVESDGGAGEGNRIPTSDIVFALLASAASWLLQLAQQPTEGINLAFVSKFLAFGEFDQLQNFLHLIERLSQRFNDLRHLANRLTNG